MRRCPIIRGTVALCFSASARNCVASSRCASPFNATVFATPDGVEDREQEQRVFGRLAECLSLFDEQVCPLGGRPSFWSGIAFDMDERSDERDLKLDLLDDATTE